jgi:asparagine synthase (glutamine-hydrolysing)
MCGILGIAGRRGASLDAVELLRHRGPDGEGRFERDDIAFAMRRLAIIDVPGADQPISNEDGSVVVICNGEIYNYLELRKELRGRGHFFSTNGDVETIVHLYEEFGEDCFGRLRGMFSVALWDDRKRRLLLARDRLGIKPLYLAEIDGCLAWSSEIQPLLALGVPARPDPQAISDYLALGYVPGEATGLRDVRSLAPGRTLVREASGVVSEREFARDDRPPPEPLETVLAEAVRLHLRSDVPLAVLLSGGVDSSLIAALAQSELDRPLQTFAVGFGDAAFDEVQHARLVADALGTEHHELIVRPDIGNDLPEIVRRLDEPNGDSSAIPLYYVCRAAASEVSVALAGEGGDEVFGGYSRYAWDRRARLIGRALPAAALAGGLERLPGVAQAAASRDRKSVLRRAVKLLRHAQLPDAERYFAWFALTSDDVRAELVMDDVERPQRVFADLFRSSPSSLTALGRLQEVDMRTMLAKDLLVKADRMSMAHSLELRVPLLDNEVVAAGLALPDKEKVRGVQTKVALRRLVEQRLPRSIARRPKQGFEVPIDRWLREDLAPLAKELLSRSRVSRHGLLDPQAVERRLAEHLDGRADHGLSLYGIMTLELWLEHVVDAGPRAVAIR